MSNRFFPFAVAGSGAPKGPRAVSASISIDELLTEACKASNAVMAYVTGMNSTSLPALPTDPDWYKKFRTEFAGVKVHAMKWANTIVPNLVGIPLNLANYAFTWNATMMSIDTALGELAKDPQNADAKRAVLAGLDRLTGGLGTFEKTVEDFAGMLREFGDQLSRDATTLREASASSKREAGFNREQVEQLTATVQSLRNEIKHWQDVQTFTLAGGAMFFFACAMIGSFTFGLAFVIGVIGVIAAVATAIAAEVKIRQLSAKLDEDLGKMSDLNKQIALLDALVTTLSDAADLAKTASAEMGGLTNTWKTIGTELKAVIASLQHAKTGVAVVEALRADLQAANTEWATLRELCLKVAAIQYLPATPATATLPRAAA